MEFNESRVDAAARPKRSGSTRGDEWEPPSSVNLRAAKHLRSYAFALDAAGARLHDEAGGRVQGYVRRVHGRLSSTADALERREWRRVAYEVRSLAEENPELVLGAAFTVGTFTGRALRTFLAGDRGGEDTVYAVTGPTPIQGRYDRPGSPGRSDDRRIPGGI